MPKKNTIGANLRFSGSCGIYSFHIGCVFVEYDLFNTTTFIQNCSFIVISRDAGTSDRCLMVSFNSRDSQVSLFL